MEVVPPSGDYTSDKNDSGLRIKTGFIETIGYNLIKQNNCGEGRLQY